MENLQQFLAGNSLLTLAFEMIVDKNYKIENKAKIELVKSLSSLFRSHGIAGGQYLDLNFEKKRKKFIRYFRYAKKKNWKII